MPSGAVGSSVLQILDDRPGLQFVGAHVTDVKNLKYIGSALGVDTIVLQAEALTSGRSGTNATLLDPLTDQGDLAKAIAMVRMMSLRASAVLRLRLSDNSPLSSLFPGGSTAGVLAFFANLKAATARFCHFAERQALDTVFLFPELLPAANAHEPPMTYRQQWSDIYQACSDAYGGNIVYVSSLAKVGPHGSPWVMDWSLWPFIGINLYPSAAASSLTRDALYKDFTQTPDPYTKSALGDSGVFPALAAMSTSLGKAIMVNECGVRPISGAQTRPWDARRQGTPDPTVQAAWWDAMGACWANYADNFVGLCAYSGDHASSHPYGVRDLPAQGIIAGRVAALRATTKNNQAVQDHQRAGPIPDVSVRRPRAVATSLPTTPSSPVTAVQFAGAPSGLAFLPDGSLLYASRDGACLVRVDINGQSTRLTLAPVSTLGSDSGVMAVAVDPRFSYNGFVYVFQSAPRHNQIVRYIMAPDGSQLSVSTTVLSGIPNGTRHNGGALAFGPDETLYIGAGDTGDPTLPQDTHSLAGKILRVNRDGSVPSDNPGPTPIWTVGHCSPTGITWDDAGTCWAIEQGATDTTTKTHGRIVRGTDKINRIVKGGNYGWPLADGTGTTLDARGIATLAPALTPTGAPSWSPGGIAAVAGRLFFGTARGLWETMVNPDSTLATPGGVASLNDGVGSVALGPDKLVWFSGSSSISKVAVGSLASAPPTKPHLPSLAATQAAPIPPNFVFEPTVPNLVTDSNGRGLRSLTIHATTTVLTSPAITRQGKYYFEFTIRTAAYPYLRVGMANALASAHGLIGGDPKSLGHDGHVLHYDNIARYPPPLSDRTFFKTGDVVGVALDWTAGKAWFRVNAGGWFNLIPGLQDPAHGVGGISCRPMLDTNGFAAAVSMGAPSQSVTVNLGQIRFTFSPPAGFRSPVAALTPSPGSSIPTKAPSAKTILPLAPPVDEPPLDDSPGARARRLVAEKLKLFNVGPDVPSIQAQIPPEVDFTLPTGGTTTPSTTPIAWPFTSVFINGYPALQLDPAGQYIAGGRLLNISKTGNPAADVVANALPANAVNGFLHIPTIDGKPTGVPNEVIAGTTPIVYDVVGKSLYAYVVNTWVLIGGGASGTTPTPTPTPSGTTLTGTTGQIVDAQGHVWTLRNTLTSSTPSTSGTTISAGTTGQIVDANGNAWTIALLTPIPTPSPSPTPTPVAGAGPVVAPTAATVVADFSSPYAGNQTVDQRLWGMAAGASDNNNFSVFGDAQFLTAAAAVNPRLWRSWGNQSSSTDPGSYSTIISNLYKANPTGDTNLIANALGASGGAIQSLASALMGSTMGNGAPFPVIGFEIANESSSQSAGAHASCYSGLQAAGNSPILGRPPYMCGPVDSCIGCNNDWAGFFSGVGNSIDVVDWHAYPDCSNEDLGTGYWGGSYASRFSNDIDSAVGNLSGPQQSLPMFLGEYNLQCYWQNATNSMQTYVGAVWAALFLTTGLNNSNITGNNRRLWATLWDSWTDNLYGAIGGALNNNGGYGINPQGQFLGAAGATIKGPRFTVQDNSGVGLVTVACIPPNPNNLNPPPMSLMVINATGSDVSNPTIGFSTAPVGSATVYQWQINSSADNSFNGNGGSNGSSPTGNTIVPVIRPSNSTALTMTNGIISGGASLPAGSVTIFYTQTDFPSASWIAT